MIVKEFVKSVLKFSGIAITQNQKYDRDTEKIIKLVCRNDSNCIDIGCHKGEMMDIFIENAPLGTHFGFEPIPAFATELSQKYQNTKIPKYQNTKIKIFNLALSDKKGTAEFNYVVSNPAYSGLKKRKYDRKNEIDQTISVKIDLLDDQIGNNVKIDIIKIDVEGAEYGVLNGANKIIKNFLPVILFEHGLGASDVYGTTPTIIYQFMEKHNYNLSTLKRWLDNKESLKLQEFENHYYQLGEFFFIAYPTNKKRSYFSS
jgi:FkbM family methyltransferase